MGPKFAIAQALVSRPRVTALTTMSAVMNFSVRGEVMIAFRRSKAGLHD